MYRYTVVLATITGLLYIIGLFIWGRPPTISSWSRFYKYFIATLTEGKPEEGIPFTNRILVFLMVFDNLMKSPIRGVGWFLDETFYPSYHKCEIKDPLFLISAARSGSTQLADYLEDDKRKLYSSCGNGGNVSIYSYGLGKQLHLF